MQRPKKVPYPVELSPELIGQVVVINSYRRTGPEEIATGSLVKYVGTLLGYRQVPERNITVVHLEGGISLSFDMKSELVEFYVYDYSVFRTSDAKATHSDSIVDDSVL